MYFYKMYKIHIKILTKHLILIKLLNLDKKINLKVLKMINWIKLFYKFVINFHLSKEYRKS